MGYSVGRSTAAGRALGGRQRRVPLPQALWAVREGQPGASASQPAASDLPETQAISASPVETPDASTPEPEQTDRPEAGTGELLADMAGTGDWQTGMRFASRVSEADVAEWVNGLGV